MKIKLIILGSIFIVFILSLVAYQKYQLFRPNSSVNTCKIGGCNSEVCISADNPNSISICDFRPEYVCYQNSRCEQQINGQCGWTQTKELKQCLSKALGNIDQ